MKPLQWCKERITLKVLSKPSQCSVKPISFGSETFAMPCETFTVLRRNLCTESERNLYNVLVQIMEANAVLLCQYWLWKLINTQHTQLKWNPSSAVSKWNITPITWKIADILPQEFSSYWESGLAEARWKRSSVFSTFFSAGERSQSVYFDRELTELRLQDFAVMTSAEKSVFPHSLPILFLLIITTCRLTSSIQTHKGIFQSFLN